METREAFRKLILPTLTKSITSENESKSSVKCTFGLGVSIKEKKEQLEKVQSSRFIVEFGLPYHLRSKMFHNKFQSIINSWHQSQNLISNSIQIQCCESDAASRVPQELTSSVWTSSTSDHEQQKEAEQQEDIIDDKRFQSRLLNLRLESLSADPSPLYQSMGLEAPFSAPSESSKRMLLIEQGEMDETQKNKKKKLTSRERRKRQEERKAASLDDKNTSDGGEPSSNKNTLVASTETSSSSSLPQKQQRDENELALHGPAQDLAPWHLKGASFGDYRRSMYTLGTDSIFSVGGMTRPIRLITMNFLSFQADALLEKHFYGHLYDHNATSLFSKLNLTDDDAEDAWFHAMQNSKWALEACSTLLHDQSIVCMPLLRRRKMKNEKFLMSSVYNHLDQRNSPVTNRDQFGEDRELDTFVRNLRGGFGNVQVVPLRRGGGGDKNRIWNRAEASENTKSRNKSDRPFEPVLVICGQNGSAAKGSVSAPNRLLTLPNAERAIAGDLVGGGNQARLADYKRMKEARKEQEQAERDGRTTSNNKAKTIKAKFQVQHTMLSPQPYRRFNKGFTRALIPTQFQSTDSIAYQHRADVRKKKGEENEKLNEAYQDFSESKKGFKY